MNTPTPATYLETYQGYDCYTRIGHKKGRTLWLFDQLTNGSNRWLSAQSNGSNRPLDHDSLEELHSRIDTDIQHKTDTKAYAALHPVLESKIRQLFQDQPVWDVQDMLTALALEESEWQLVRRVLAAGIIMDSCDKWSLFSRILANSGIRIHYPSNNTICLWSKEVEQKTLALRQAARKEVEIYPWAPTYVIPNSKKKPKLTGEFFQSRPIGRNRFTTVRNSTILVTVGENWKARARKAGRHREAMVGG